MDNKRQNSRVCHQRNICIIEGDAVAKAVIKTAGIGFTVDLNVTGHQPIADLDEPGKGNFVENITNDEISLPIKLADLFVGYGDVVEHACS